MPPLPTLMAPDSNFNAAGRSHGRAPGTTQRGNRVYEWESLEYGGKGIANRGFACGACRCGLWWRLRRRRSKHEPAPDGPPVGAAGNDRSGAIGNADLVDDQRQRLRGEWRMERYRSDERNASGYAHDPGEHPLHADLYKRGWRLLRGRQHQ